MFSDKITFEDFNGNTVTEEIFFNISKMEMLEMDASHNGQYGEYLQEIANTEDVQALLGAFKDIVKLSYGVKSEDGKRFVKSDEEFKKFEESPAYDEFMIKLMTQEDYALKFILGVMPSAEGVTEETIRNNVKNSLPMTN